ncbi:MAG TPA: cyclase family protein, partial [Anaerolineales bacterium]|nr:cyclase family protein [Anaerolineales bacterium]
MKIYDITPPLHASLEVWPGDAPVALTPVQRLAAGAAVNLSSLTMSLHAGAHADAPWHFQDEGPTIETLALEPFLGPARLVRLQTEGQRIEPSDLEELLVAPPKRLLICCNPGRDPDRFPSTFAYFSAEAAARIAQASVRLLGTDAPSVDAVDSKELPAHHALWAGGALILENLDLRNVPEGEYELIALPLPILGADGSPIRAVLRE